MLSKAVVNKALFIAGVVVVLRIAEKKIPIVSQALNAIGA